MEADVGPLVAWAGTGERFEALISWLPSDEAMGLALGEVESRLQADLAELVHQLVIDQEGARSDGIGCPRE